MKRTADYGSAHYDTRRLAIPSVKVSDDGRGVRLVVPDIRPTWCMEIRYHLTTADGMPVEGRIHNTIHALPHD